jgi:hypothetical protein
MHGMEYAFSQMLMQYGMLTEGVTVAKGVRDRYDGAKRNPWNEIECGSNYARSMSSWGAMIVLAGFTYDARTGHIGFAPKVRRGDRFASVWSSGTAHGAIEMRDGSATLTVIGGTLELASLGLPGGGVPSAVTVNERPLAFDMDGGMMRLKRVRLAPNDVVEIASPSLKVSSLPDVDAL